jgi:hypothetical protein
LASTWAARGFDGALQLIAPRGQRTRLEARFLRLALQRALLLAGIGQLALGGDHRVFQLGVALLRLASCMSSSSKRASPVARRSSSVFELRVDLGQFLVQLLAALCGFGLLRQAQQFHLQLVGAGLRFAGFAPRRSRRCEASV